MMVRLSMMDPPPSLYRIDGVSSAKPDVVRQGWLRSRACRLADPQSIRRWTGWRAWSTSWTQPTLMDTPSKSRRNSTTPRYEPRQISTSATITWRSQALVTVSSVIDLTDTLCLFRGTVEDIGRQIKRRFRTEIGEWMVCSIGVGPNRFLAKL